MASDARHRVAEKEATPESAGTSERAEPPVAPPASSGRGAI
jgi:hypothetical protein